MQGGLNSLSPLGATASASKLPMTQPKFLIPPKREDAPKYTVVFDLDETLVNNRRIGKALIRPGVSDLLRSLVGKAEVVLWTASIENVAVPAIKQMDPDGIIFEHCVYRDRRWYRETGYTKDLRLLGRDLSTVVIVENSPMSVKLNRGNAILVRDFITNMQDDSMAIVKDILLGLIESNEPVAEYLAANSKLTKNHEVLPSSSAKLLSAMPLGTRGNAIHIVRHASVPASVRGAAFLRSRV